ncbi:hypothetical protein ACJJH9_05150 [Microbulbifer sp. DLAB2-AF]
MKQTHNKQRHNRPQNMRAGLTTLRSVRLCAGRYVQCRDLSDDI